jgi:hypothetical protein
MLVHYNGNGWTDVTSTVPSRSSVPYLGFYGTAPNSVYLVDQFGEVLFWNGMAWALMDSGYQNSLNSISGTMGGHLWTVGPWGTVLHRYP